jgi:hypothetical protein
VVGFGASRPMLRRRIVRSGGHAPGKAPIDSAIRHQVTTRARHARCLQCHPGDHGLTVPINSAFSTARWGKKDPSGRPLRPRDAERAVQFPAQQAPHARVLHPRARPHQGVRRPRQRRAWPAPAGHYDDQFPVDVLQTGSGTSSNMNVNEPIASQYTAAELSGQCAPCSADRGQPARSGTLDGAWRCRALGRDSGTADQLGLTPLRRPHASSTPCARWRSQCA